MKNNILILSLLLIQISIYAQSHVFEWAKSMGGTDRDVSESIAIDDFGNVYTTGKFRGTTDFDPGSANQNLTSNGDFDIYIHKMDEEGNLIWVKSIGGTEHDWGSSITTDKNGNVYITGQFNGQVDFDPSNAVSILNSNGKSDIFILKLDSTGDMVWVKSFGSTMHDGAFSVATDPSGNVFITGTYADTVDFDPISGGHVIISNGDFDIFILKLSSLGNVTWVKSMGGNDRDDGKNVIADSAGNVYTVGYFDGNVDFDPGVGSHNLISKGYRDFFIQKLDANGDLLWANSYGGKLIDFGEYAHIDDKGNVYITGYFTDTVHFSPGNPNYTLVAKRARDVFIEKLDDQGNFLWAKSFGGSGSDWGHAVTVDKVGNIYIAGSYEDTVDFDPGTAVYNKNSNGNHDVYIQKLDDNGNFLWAGSVGGSLMDDGLGLAVDNANNIYVTGYFEGTVDFDPGNSTFNLISKGLVDAFVLKLKDIYLGIEDELEKDLFEFYPNPSSGKFTLDMHSTGSCELTVYNVIGRKVFEKHISESRSVEIELPPLDDGVYFLQLKGQSHYGSKKLLLRNQ